MNTRVHSFVATSLATLILAAHAPAQNANRDMREVAVPMNTDSGFDVGRDGFVRSRANSGTGPTTVEWYVPDSISGSGSTQVLSLAVQSSRIFEVEPLAAGRVLIAGQRITNPATMEMVGTLELVAIDPVALSFTLLASVDLPGIDPIEAEYDTIGQTLFLIDRAGRSVVGTYWDGSATLPATFSTVVDYTTYPALARPRVIDLDAYGVRAGVDVYDESDVRYRHYEAGTSAGTWTEDSTEWLLNLSGPRLEHTTSFVAVNRPWDIGVIGAASYPLALDLLNEAGTSESVSIPSAGSSLTTPAHTTTPDTFVRLSSQDAGELSLRTCLRYGVSQNVGLAHFGPVECDIVGPFAERSGYTVIVDLLPDDDDGIALPQDLSGEVWIAIALPGAAAPVTLNGDDATLNAQEIVPFSVPAGVRPSDLSFQMPAIPAGTAGIRVFTQIALTDGNEVAYSEVFGISIRPDDPVTVPN